MTRGEPGALLVGSQGLPCLLLTCSPRCRGQRRWEPLDLPSLCSLAPTGLPTGEISGGHESAFHSLLKILILPLVFMPFKSGNEFYNFSSGAQLVARVVKLNFINISHWDLRKSIKEAEREKEKEKGKEQRQ